MFLNGVSFRYPRFGLATVWLTAILVFSSMTGFSLLVEARLCFSEFGNTKASCQDRLLPDCGRTVYFHNPRDNVAHNRIRAVDYSHRKRQWVMFQTHLFSLATILIRRISQHFPRQKPNNYLRIKNFLFSRRSRPDEKKNEKNLGQNSSMCNRFVQRRI